MKQDYIGSVPDVQKYPDDNEPEEEITDFDDPRKDEKEPSFYETLTGIEKRVYECGYRKCKSEVLRVLQGRKPYFDIFDELNDKLEKHINGIKRKPNEQLNEVFTKIVNDIGGKK